MKVTEMDKFNLIVQVEIKYLNSIYFIGRFHVLFILFNRCINNLVKNKTFKFVMSEDIVKLRGRLSS
jgi:hypothetical protein